MTLEQWQIALRREAAIKESFRLAESGDQEEDGSYTVVNPISKSIYKVVYRGEKSPWNFCSCMDFKLNQLGTCKHLEAVKLWIGKNHMQIHASLPVYTSVYLNYVGKQEVCIRIGSERRDAFIQLATRYFSHDNKLLPEGIQNFSAFLKDARKISDSFRCYPDAMKYILDIRDRQKRTELIQKTYVGNLNDLLRTSLYPYQEEGIKFAFKAGKSIIADEMGLGKTIQAIGCAELLRKEKFISSVLILCPSSLKYQWKKEIEKFTGEMAQVVEGYPLQRKQQYVNSSAFYKIASYNTVCSDMKAQRTMYTDMLVMDEAQRLKNWNSQIAKAVHKIESEYTIVLSGTPLENKLQDLFTLVQFVSPFCLGPYYRFVDFTTIFSVTGQILGYRNLDVVGQKLKPVMIRRRKKEVLLQLPERCDQNLFVPMTGEQRAIHEECKVSVAQIVDKWRHGGFLSETDRRRLLLLLNQMRMVSDSTFVLDQVSRHDTKIDELMDVVENMIENGEEKMVVFSQWERMTRLICQDLDKRGIDYAYLNGSVPSAKRKELMDRFTEKPDCRIFVSTDAGSTGLNLQIASWVVNLDLPWNPAILEQRVGRIYRIGQKRNIQVINFVSEGSIEERMLTTLDFKSHVAEGVLDTGESSVFLEDEKFDELMSMVVEIAGKNDVGICENTKFEKEEEKERIGESEVEKNFMFDNEEITSKEDISGETSKLVEDGISFFSQLADTLSSEEKRKKLMDALVKVDSTTGKMLLEIPVSNKDDVEKILNVLAMLLKQM